MYYAIVLLVISVCVLVDRSPPKLDELAIAYRGPLLGSVSGNPPTTSSQMHSRRRVRPVGSLFQGNG